MSSELLASRIGERLWTALREGGRTVELHVEAEGAGEPRVERIVKARITGEARHLGAVFADVGGPRAAFVDARDLPIDALRTGRELVVQIRREGRGGRGPRASAHPSLAGRGLVLLPGTRRRTVSRRIDDEAERARLGSLLARLPSPDAGWIARAAAQGRAEDELRAEAERLASRWAAALDEVARRAAPAIVLEEPGLLEQQLREAPPEGFSRIVVDDERDRQVALAWLRVHDPARIASVALHAARTGLFEARGVDLELELALARSVALPSGGELVIEETEALVAVDVNTGQAPGVGGDAEQTYLSTNREAAVEIARQLRLRGLGGLVVVDFIDMRRKASGDAVLAALRAALRTDPVRTKIASLEPLGLVALTREARRPALASRVTRACRVCGGTGRLLRGPER